MAIQKKIERIKQKKLLENLAVFDSKGVTIAEATRDENGAGQQDSSIDQSINKTLQKKLKDPPKSSYPMLIDNSGLALSYLNKGQN